MFGVEHASSKGPALMDPWRMGGGVGGEDEEGGGGGGGEEQQASC